MEEVMLSEAEAKALFIRFKKAEAGDGLSALERGLLLKIEKALYAGLSVAEAEKLMIAIAKS
jgi:hypothetical protein